jgi:hypothetical protein
MRVYYLKVPVVLRKLLLKAWGKPSAETNKD